MKYDPFAPDPDTVTARILKHSTADATPDPARHTPETAHTQSAGGSDLPVPATLDGITALHDTVFVEAAYRLLLGRDADPEGLAHYVQQLRSGALDKIDILGDLRYSTEGQVRSVEIEGLRWRYSLRRAGRRPGVGPVVRWFTALVRLPALLRTGQRHQAAIEEHAAVIQTIAGELRKTAAELQEYAGHVSRIYGPLPTRLRNAENGLENLAERLTETESTFAARYQHVGDANARLVQQMHDVIALRDRNIPVTAVPQHLPAQQTTRHDPEDLDNWYVAFEDSFRGSRDQIKRWQEIYLDYVALAGAGTLSAPILDIGCGRGEWLELLAEHGCIASGVDLNTAMIRANQDRGLRVVQQDAIAYLRDLPESSLGMVTGFHIIEHLRFDVLVRLFDECRRVLKPGGCALFETPNPENLVVGAYTFYFDPTHHHPLPPQLIEHVVRERGFADVEILRLHPREESGADDAFLNRWFRSATDYAVIGWKDGKGSVCAS